MLTRESTSLSLAKESNLMSPTQNCWSETDQLLDMLVSPQPPRKRWINQSLLLMTRSEPEHLIVPSICLLQRRVQRVHWSTKPTQWYSKLPWRKKRRDPPLRITGQRKRRATRSQDMNHLSRVCPTAKKAVDSALKLTLEDTIMPQDLFSLLHMVQWWILLRRRNLLLPSRSKSLLSKSLKEQRLIWLPNLTLISWIRSECLILKERAGSLFLNSRMDWLILASIAQVTKQVFSSKDMTKIWMEDWGTQITVMPSLPEKDTMLQCLNKEHPSMSTLQSTIEMNFSQKTPESKSEKL